MILKVYLLFALAPYPYLCIVYFLKSVTILSFRFLFIFECKIYPFITWHI